MPTHDDSQARMNARDELHEAIRAWAEKHPEMIYYPRFVADHACEYIFNDLIGEGDE